MNNKIRTYAKVLHIALIASYDRQVAGEKHTATAFNVFFSFLRKS